tara:strand:+ start:180 stop:1424 length:1245 start_codon:yes stop_codon:yes gene_type:complete
MKKLTLTLSTILPLISLGQTIFISTGAILTTGTLIAIESQKAIAEDSKFYFDRANKKRKSGNYKGAISDYTEAIKINPNSYNSYYYRSVTKDILKDSLGALSDINKAIEMNPKDADFYYARGIINKKLKKPFKAMYDYSQAIELNEKSAAKKTSFVYNSSYYNLANIKYDLKDYSGAIDNYSRIINLNPNYKFISEVYFFRGSAKYNSGNYSGAIADYSTLLNKHPKYYRSDAAYYYSGRSKMKLNNNNEAVDDFTKAIAIKPKSNYYFQRAFANYSLDNYSEAIADFTKVINDEPKNAVAYYNRGLSKYYSGNKSAAIGDFLEAYTAKPDYANAFWMHGKTIAQVEGSPQGKRGCRSIERAIRLGQKDAIKWGKISITKDDWCNFKYIPYRGKANQINGKDVRAENHILNYLE